MSNQGSPVDSRNSMMPNGMANAMPNGMPNAMANAMPNGMPNGMPIGMPAQYVQGAPQMMPFAGMGTPFLPFPSPQGMPTGYQGVSPHSNKTNEGGMQLREKAGIKYNLSSTSSESEEDSDSPTTSKAEYPWNNAGATKKARPGRPPGSKNKKTLIKQAQEKASKEEGKKVSAKAPLRKKYGICRVCLRKDHEGNFVCSPCGHGYACEKCLIDARDTNDSCPYCRTFCYCPQRILWVA